MGDHAAVDINIFLHSPLFATRRIRVRPSLNVGHLSRSFPGEDVSFYFNGLILEPLNTFIFYDIHEDADIFAVRKSERSGPSMEAARVSDLRLLRLSQMSGRNILHIVDDGYSGNCSRVFGSDSECGLIPGFSKSVLPRFWDSPNKELVLTE